MGKWSRNLQKQPKNQLIVLLSQRMAKLLQQLRISLNNHRNDRSCVIWRFNIEAEKKLEPVLKLTQNNAILTLSFNPLTHELFSGGASDFALFIPGRK